MPTFRPYEPQQQLLLPPSLHEWLPSDHLVWFIAETIDQLDLREIVDSYRDRAAKQDTAEDVEFGPDFRGDELPEELQRREDRLAKIREAKRRLEARKREEVKVSERKEDDDPPKRGGRPRKYPLGKPKPKDQKNFTDPESRIMKEGSGAFQQCYNAQAT